MGFITYKEVICMKTIGQRMEGDNESIGILLEGDIVEKLSYTKEYSII